MKFKTFFFVFCLFFIASCANNQSTIYDNGIIKISSTPSIDPTNVNPQLTATTSASPDLKTVKPDVPVNNPLIAHWLISSVYREKETIYVLGDNLQILFSYSGLYPNGYLNTTSCNIIQLSHYFTNNETDLSEGFKMERFSITGENITSNHIQFSHDPVNIYDMQVSPTLEWMTYKLATQWEKLYSIQDSHNQDVFILPINFEKEVKAIKLTENSGAWQAPVAWSPDGNLLSFTDFDKGGNQQLFLYDPIKNLKYQKTNLQSTNEKYYIFDFKWSADSKNIVIVYGSAVNNESQFFPGTNGMMLFNIDFY